MRRTTEKEIKQILAEVIKEQGFSPDTYKESGLTILHFKSTKNAHLKYTIGIVMENLEDQACDFALEEVKRLDNEHLLKFEGETIKDRRRNAAMSLIKQYMNNVINDIAAGFGETLRIAPAVGFVNTIANAKDFKLRNEDIEMIEKVRNDSWKSRIVKHEGGRDPISKEKIEAIVKAAEKGASLSKISEKVGVSRNTVKKYLSNGA